MLKTARTYIAKVTNYQQIRDDLDRRGFSASKLWDVERYYTNNGGTTTVR